MLTPDYFYGKPDRLLEMYQELENWILQDIAVRLLEADELTATADRELWKLQQMGLHKKEIIKRISKLTGISQREVKRLLKESVMTSFSDDKEVLENLMELTPPMKNKTIIDVMNAELIKTMGELSNLTNTTINQSQTDLLNLLNEVDFRVAAGLQSYSSAVCEVLDRYAGNGVMINYPTGSRRSLEAAVRCCIVTSMNQTAAQVTNQYIVESGAEYVLVSAHYGARHDEKNPNGVSSHDAWQGGVYKINGSDPDTPNLLEATGYDIDTVTGKGHVVNPLGLHGYNCRHSHKPWMKSFGNPNLDENGNVKVDIHESQKIYEMQQKQRAIERAIRKTKRQLLVKDQEKKQYPDELSIHEEYDKLEQKLRYQNKMYNEFCKENGLQPQYDRVKVAGFGKQKESASKGSEKIDSNSVKMPIEKSTDSRYTKRTKEEFEQTARQIKEEITKYSDRPSKWSGKINVNNAMMSGGTLGAKEWSCDISLVDAADNGTVWHEMLHSCSCSYFEQEIYDKNEYIEEASVEWLKQQICKEKNISNSYAYEDKTIILQVLNDYFSFGTDMEFAKEIYNVPLPERYKWLEQKVDEILRRMNVSFEDYNDVMRFVKYLEGGSNGRH